ncbi:PIG-L family deacetylase [Candidatus Woesearchaeota archaeon]|nr:PIG-L family deacetylase [Candidatus Woesearchaeota archaeon]
MSIENTIRCILREKVLPSHKEKQLTERGMIYVAQGVNLDEALGGNKPKEIVFCPHQDDAEIGIGPYLAKYYHAKGFLFVYHTNGVGGLIRDAASRERALQLFGKEPNEIVPEELVQRRREQAEKAMEFFQVPAGIFLGYDSIKKGHAREREASIETVALLLNAIKPEKIFIPQPFDQHLTHRIATYICGCAAARASWDGEILGYSVWGPVPYDVPTQDEFFEEGYVDMMRAAIHLHKTEMVKNYGEAKACMMRMDAIATVNKPDALSERYLMRNMKLGHLKGMTRQGVRDSIASCIHDKKMANEFLENCDK